MKNTLDKYRQQLACIAKDYHQQAFLVHEVGKRLIERLSYIRLEPQIILDQAAKTGFTTTLLKEQYPQAMLVQHDVYEGLLAQQKATSTRLCGDYQAMSIADNQIDLLLANLVLPWAQDVGQVLQEWARVLKPGGVLLFSTLGPDTFKELRVENQASDFIDMHDVGDAMLQVGLENPVVDAEWVTLEYAHVEQCMDDLRRMGFENWLEQTPSLTTEPFTLTVEVVYGHAYYPLTQTQNIRTAPDEVAIPISSIARSRS